MEMIGVIKKGLIISSAAVLIACGGGGGGGGGGTGSSLSYTGKTAPAKITNDNADELVGANEGSTDSAEAGSASLTGGATSRKRRNRSIGISRSLNDAATSASADFQGGSVAAIVQEDGIPVEGSCGGTRTTTGYRDDAEFNVDLTVTFNNFCDDFDGTIINGVMAIKGREYADKSFDWTLTFTDLSFKNSEGHAILAGSIASKGSKDKFSVVMNYLVKDVVADKVYKAENLAVTIERFPFGGYILGTISGTLYHPDHGSFTIVTDPALKIYDDGDYPVAGKITIEGAEGSFASAEYLDDGTYILTVYDGVTTTKKSCDSITGVCKPI